MIMFTRSSERVFNISRYIGMYIVRKYLDYGHDKKQSHVGGSGTFFRMLTCNSALFLQPSEGLRTLGPFQRIRPLGIMEARLKEAPDWVHMMPRGTILSDGSKLG